MTPQPKPAMAETERPLPENLHAERAILGAILLDPSIPNDALDKANAIIDAKDFHHIHHRLIFRCMTAMVAHSDVAIDLVSLSDQLQRKGKLEAAGGAAYLAQLVDGVPRVSHVEFYARIVKEKSVLRQMIYAAHAIQQQASEAEEDAEVILAHAAETVSKLQAAVQKPAVASYTAPELVALAHEPVEYVVYPFAARGMVALLDGAAKAAGKTTFILTAVGASFREELFLNHATKRGRVLLVTEENPRTLHLALKRAGLTEETDLHIIPFSSLASLPWPQLVQHVEKKCIDLGIGWLILDTFYAVAGLGGEEENKAGSVDAAVAPLRYIAGRLDIPVTLSRHERKSGGDVGSSGRGSSALTGAADIVLLLKRFQGNHSLQKRKLEITGRIEQVRLTIELRDGKYIVAPDEDVENPADEAERLTQAIIANPKASIRQLEAATGIGRNRVTKLAAKAGWHYTASGWEQGGS